MYHFWFFAFILFLATCFLLTLLIWTLKNVINITLFSINNTTCISYLFFQKGYHLVFLFVFIQRHIFELSSVGRFVPMYVGSVFYYTNHARLIICSTVFTDFSRADKFFKILFHRYLFFEYLPHIVSIWLLFYCDHNHNDLNINN